MLSHILFSWLVGTQVTSTHGEQAGDRQGEVQAPTSIAPGAAQITKPVEKQISVNVDRKFGWFPLRERNYDFDNDAPRFVTSFPTDSEK